MCMKLARLARLHLEVAMQAAFLFGDMICPSPILRPLPTRLCS